MKILVGLYSWLSQDCIEFQIVHVTISMMPDTGAEVYVLRNDIDNKHWWNFPNWKPCSWLVFPYINGKPLYTCGVFYMNISELFSGKSVQ